MKVNVNAGRCEIYVQGMDMKCPLCGVLVRSGEQHECKLKSTQPKRKGKA
jgi:hypothetical protein